MTIRSHVLDVSLPEAALAPAVTSKRRPRRLIVLATGVMIAAAGLALTLANIPRNETPIAPRPPATAPTPPVAPPPPVVAPPPEPPPAQQPIAPQVAAPSPPAGTRIVVERGQSLSMILSRAGVESADAQAALAALAEVGDISRLTISQEIRLTTSDDGVPELREISLAIDPVRTLTAVRSADGTYSARVTTPSVRRETTTRRLRIETSLYDAATAAGIAPALAPLVRAYAYDVDFQRDLRAGDTLDILFERDVADDGRPVRTGTPVYARLRVGGRDHTLVRFRPAKGEEEYFTAQGERARREMLRTPLDAARVTSAFGMREHPILGYTKKHRGLDFGAPSGTPVMAAADGIVEEVGEAGGYGNLVRLRHAGVLATAYAHLSRFARGLKPGTRVRQGQVIAYVGSTGRSTGPHLHFEVLKGGKPINPATKTAVKAATLAGADLDAFKKVLREMEQRVQEFSKNDRA